MTVKIVVWFRAHIVRFPLFAITDCARPENVHAEVPNAPVIKNAPSKKINAVTAKANV